MLNDFFRSTFIFLTLFVIAHSLSRSWEDNDEIKRFQEYLRIPSVYPNVNYEGCVAFLKEQADNLSLPFSVQYMDPNNPVVIITWFGTDPLLPSIMLNSHMDVVTADESKWTHRPFDAEIDENGRIYARGSQDAKSMGMQYLGAIRQLQKSNERLKRTVHVIFVPDEEEGGSHGMAKFVKTDVFEQLNIGFALDEGAASETDDYSVHYAERDVWRIVFHINGVAGHGSWPASGTAGEKLRLFLDKIMDLRTALNADSDDSFSDIGNKTTINLTKIQGGQQTNVLPSLIDATFDIRVGLSTNHKDLEKQLNTLVNEVGDIDIEFKIKSPHSPATILDNTNKYWLAFTQALQDMGATYKSTILGGATDSRFLRSVGIPAIGFSTATNTPPLAHAHDEYLSADVYLKGIEVYKNILLRIANVD